MVNCLIHQITGPKANQFINGCLNSWDKLKSNGFIRVIWTDESIEQFLITNYSFALDAFKKARNHGEAADIARYLILHFFGGYYVDWDIELIRPDLFLQLHSEFPNGYLLIDPKTDALSSEHFSCLKNEEYLLKLCEDIVFTYERGERDLMDTQHFSGPDRMRVALKRHPICKQQIIPIKDVFEYDFWEIRKMDGRSPTKPMIHYWLHTWM